MKRVFLVHGWGGSPDNCWFPWLKNKLEENGFVVQVPAMPHPENPTIEDWVNCLANAVGQADSETYFVGHSIGCQTILRYIERLRGPVGGVVCVAGWFRLLHLATDEEKEIARPWLETLLDYERVKQNVSKIVAIFSDNDPDVDVADSEFFKNNLNAKIIIEHNKRHFSDDAGITELPVVLEELLKL